MNDTEAHLAEPTIRSHRRFDDPRSCRSTSARILLIEDHDELRESLRASLEESGYEVVTAQDGTQGLLEFVRGQPDLVVLDLELAGMYGMRVLGEIRERSPDVPVVLLTNDSAPVDSAVPSVIVLRKPFRTDWLLGAIYRALGSGPSRRGSGLRSVREL